jgi:hypothetical protein
MLKASSFISSGLLASLNDMNKVLNDPTFKLGIVFLEVLFFGSSSNSFHACHSPRVVRVSRQELIQDHVTVDLMDVLWD